MKSSFYDRRLFVFAFLFLVFCGPYSRGKTGDSPHVVLVGEDRLFQKQAFAYRIPDATASDGNAVVLIRRGKVELGQLGWTLDDSRLQLGREHTLYAVVKIEEVERHKKKRDRPLLRVDVTTRGKKRLAKREIPFEELRASPNDRSGWREIKLLTFTLERDSVVDIVTSRHTDVQELLLDRLYLVSDYPPVDEEKRKAELRPLYPKEHYSRLFKDFSISLVYRMKNPLKEEPRSVLERQLYDIRLHHVDTLTAGGIPKNAPPREAEKIIQDLLDISQRLGLRVEIPLTAFFPEDLLNKFSETQLPTEENMKIVRKVVEQYIPRFKDHPALLGYLLVDEPYPHQIPLLVAIQREIEKVDPVHPVITSAQSPHQVYTWADSQNVIFSGVYPYGAKKDYSQVWGLRSLLGEIRKNLFKGYFFACIQGFTRGNRNRVTRADYRLQAHVQLLAGVDGLKHYVYFPHLYPVESEQSENYGFINFVEGPYEGELDLWKEVERFGERFFPLRGILQRLEEIPANDEIRVESEILDLHPVPRRVIQWDMKELPDIGDVLFLLNMDATRERGGRLIFSQESLKGDKVYDLFRLDEVPIRNGSIDLSIPPGDLLIYLIAEPLAFKNIQKEIEIRRLKEDLRILRLRMQPAGLKTLDGIFSNIENGLSKSEFTAEERAELLSSFSAVRDRANRALLEDRAFQDFTRKLHEIEKALSRIDATLKTHKIVKERVSKKKAAKFGLEESVEWKSTSSQIEGVDKEFRALAKRYLTLKTAYVTGHWRDLTEELETLQGETSRAVAKID